MTAPKTAGGLGRYLLWTVYFITSMICAVYSFLFGERVGGVLLGVVLAINCAAFCAVMLSGIVERLSRLAARVRRPS